MRAQTSPKRLIELGDAIAGRLTVERVTDLSDAELARGLGPCVCAGMLLRLAHILRECGLLYLDGARVAIAADGDDWQTAIRALRYAAQ